MTTTSLPGSIPPQADTDRLPWPSLLVLGATTLVTVTGEMLPTAVLGQLSAGLGVAEARTGLLVSVWAAVVVVASLPLVRLTRRWDRRTVIAGSLVAFALSGALTAIAPAYGVALAARALGAAAAGLLWATVNAYVADLVPDRLLGRATAVVLSGATMGMVLGTPLGRFVADLAGWRASFWTLTVAALVAAGCVWRIVPARPAGGGTGTDRQIYIHRDRAPMLTVALLVAVVILGHYGAYTYITRLAEQPATILPGGMATLLLGFGLASAAGVALAGQVGTRLAVPFVASIAATAIAMLGLSLAGQHAAIGLLLVLAWGVASGALPPLAQTQILRLAGPEHRSLAGALIPVLFNGGIAVGAAVASAIVARHGVDALLVPAAAIVAVPAAGLAAVLRRQRLR